MHSSQPPVRIYRLNAPFNVPHHCNSFRLLGIDFSALKRMALSFYKVALSCHLVFSLLRSLSNSRWKSSAEVVSAMMYKYPSGMYCTNPEPCIEAMRMKTCCELYAPMRKRFKVKTNDDEDGVT